MLDGIGFLTLTCGSQCPVYPLNSQKVAPPSRPRPIIDANFMVHHFSIYLFQHEGFGLRT